MSSGTSEAQRRVDAIEENPWPAIERLASEVGRLRDGLSRIREAVYPVPSFDLSGCPVVPNDPRVDAMHQVDAVKRILRELEL